MSTETPQEQTESSSSSQPNFVAFEHEILDFWREHRCFETLRSKLAGKPLFRFLDGPITANNPMGVHHAWGRSLKDIFIRYKCLTGHSCQFQNGFDCQGLWVEVEVEKDLGFRGKPDIEAFGLDKFSNACKVRVEKFSGIQTQQSIRLGQWMDWQDSYYTHSDRNIEGIWKFLATCKENGWLYKSGLPMPWCTRCGTSLSEHEMAGSYKTLSHLAVYLKIPVPALRSRILVWTTTPWTLPANVALAVNPALRYSQVEIEGHDTPLILSSDVLKSWEGASLKKVRHSILKTWNGSELVGVEYEPLFAELPAQQGFAHRIVPWEDVDPREGTGVVHIAPGCGLEDFELSKLIELRRLTPVDEKGDYVAGYGILEGKNARTIGPEIAEHLKGKGLLYSQYMHEHSYPVCWRCKEELIFRLVDEWYISTKDVRPRLIEAAAEVKWQPEHIGKRMENWLQNMGDWCISRKRYWGLPLPFYPCTKCHTLTVVNSREELKRLSGNDLSSIHELHRPWIDEVQIRCPQCSAAVSRVAEVGDCWLDAGIVPFTTRGCYGQSKEGTLLESEWKPADWICEMSEQVRLWFYSMLFMGVTLKGRAPYRHVLTHESVRAETGAKFSKTGYMIRFDEASEKMGVDTMRYYFASQPPTSDIRFGYGPGDEARRQIMPLWNVFSFFDTYARLDKPQLSTSPLAASDLSLTDRWVLAKLFDFVSAAMRAYEELNTPAVVREFEVFMEGLSNWYVRSNRRRFWKGEASSDKHAGYWTLYQAIRAVTLVMSPIMPFLTEKVWQECVRRYDTSATLSVHFSEWPTPPAVWQDAKLLLQVERVRQIITIAHRIRTDAKIKVRQPLAELIVCADGSYRDACAVFESALLNELNIKGLRFVDSQEKLFEEYVELDLKRAGPVLRGEVSMVVSVVNALDQSETKKVLAAVHSQQEVTLAGYKHALPPTIFVIKTRPQRHLATHSEQSLFVALDTTINEDLEQEGWVREILRQTQVLRKDSALNVEDRIHLAISSPSAEIRNAISKHRPLIEEETLGSLCEDISTPQGKCHFALFRGEHEVGTVEVSLQKRCA